MNLRERTKQWSDSRWAYPIAALIAFLEGSFLIIAVEPLLALAAFVRVIGASARGWIEDHQLEIFTGGIILFVIIGAAILLL